MIRSGIAVLAVTKLIWAITAGRAALLVTEKIIIRQQRGVTRWEAVRGTNIGRWKMMVWGAQRKR